MGKLNEKAMLVKVELKKWGGTKTDKSLAEEISDNHSTDSSLYSVSKKLTKNATLKAIKKIDGLKHFPLEKLLTDKYKLKPEEAKGLADFLLLMLKWRPSDRPTA